MKKKKRFIIIFALIAIVLVLSVNGGKIPKLIVQQIVIWQDEQVAWPKDGTYYCRELNMELTFSADGNTAKFADGTIETLHVDYGGRFEVPEGDSQLLTFYHWNQKKDTLKVQILRFTGEFDPDTKYIFERVT